MIQIRSLVNGLARAGKNGRARKMLTAEKKIRSLAEAYGPGDYPGAVYGKGDFIGKTYEVLGVLGVGGFSVVYLVFSHETESVHALKTIRDELLEDGDMRKQFRGEAEAWLSLEHHPHIVSAHFIEEVAGRLHIGMEYIEPNEDGVNSLEDILGARQPELEQCLRWAVQFCHGMEYANASGIRCHRDVKPANIMITKDRVAKITDFGFADVFDPVYGRGGIQRFTRTRRRGEEKYRFGTPNYMPPEQFQSPARCDARSDIYSFGIVLYQMASGGPLPFTPELRPRGVKGRSPNIWEEMHRLHAESPVPRIRSPLYPVIKRCLQKEQSARYQTFQILRQDLEKLLRRHGARVDKPKRTREVEAWKLYNKAFSLASLGQHKNAVKLYDRVLRLEPRNSDAWNNRGVCCMKLGKTEDALTCYENATKTNRHNASAWMNNGNALYTLGRYSEALVSLNKATRFDSLSRSAWLHRARCEDRLRLTKEAAASFRKFLEIESDDCSEHVEYARKRLAELRGKTR
ncbi:MAG: serine/threonine-protein kinase [Bacteroidota bacterium]